jgi:GTP-binding protein Era
MHKAGFVNIIGNPNVGKSTLMNALVGEKLSIITSKAQTTRHRIMGILNGDDFQIVYSDTPGILDPKYKLQQSMMEFVNSALTDADIILFVVDITDENQVEEKYLKKISSSKSPVLVLLNKVDLSTQDKLEEKVTHWKEQFKNAEVIPVSARQKFNVKYIFDRIIALLPENPPYFPKDQVTDKSERFFVAEIIREKILLYYQKEIPYAVEVVVDTFKDEEKIVKIRCEIIVERESQKAIVIGHQGKALKKTGTEARKDMEVFLNKKVFLELFVKVDKDWRNSDNRLRNYGYFNQ